MDKTLLQFKIKAKKDKMFEKWENGCAYMKLWWSENKEWAIFVIPLVAAGAAKVISAGSKVIISANQAKAADVNARTVWDPNLQIHHTLKHAMTPKETQDYIALVQGGMKMNEALTTLNLI